MVVLNECLLLSAFSCMAEIETYMQNKFSIMCFVLPLLCPVKISSLTTVLLKCYPLKMSYVGGINIIPYFAPIKPQHVTPLAFSISPANLSQRGRVRRRVPTKRGLSFCYVSQGGWPTVLKCRWNDQLLRKASRLNGNNVANLPDWLTLANEFIQPFSERRKPNESPRFRNRYPFRIWLSVFPCYVCAIKAEIFFLYGDMWIQTLASFDISLKCGIAIFNFGQSVCHWAMLVMT